MPSQILHALFGEDVINRIHHRLRGRFGIVADKALEKIRGYGAVFALGCQGPDIFYHSQRTRPVAVEYGGLLHRRDYGVFTANLLKMGLPDPPPDAEDIRAGRREKGISALGVYSLGFMTHAVLDRFCHPYIIYRTTRPGTPVRDGLGRLAHPFFERILDVLMLKRLRNRELSSWDQGLLAEVCEKPPLGLRELIERALAASYPGRAGKDRFLGLRIANAFADSAVFYRRTASPLPGSAERSREGETAGDRRERILNYSAVLSLFPETAAPPEGPEGPVPPADPPDSLRGDGRETVLPGENGPVDFLNLARGVWQDPAGPENRDTRSFPDLYGEALNAAAASFLPCITAYLEKGIFPIREAASAIGNGSLYLQDGTGKPCAPLRGDPFPLAEIFGFS
jgi:hypothetical protein